MVEAAATASNVRVVSPQSPLLTTKLYIPTARKELVPRPRLTERLNEGLTRTPGVTLISAPAGFGKTTMLSAWIPHRQGGVTWVSLDEGDNDPTRFWVYFIGAIQKLQSNLGENALLLLQSPQPPSFEFILTTLLNELAACPDDFALVLDDYHVIENPAIHEAITFLLNHLASPLHLIITTRVDPFLPLSRLRARNQLTELRAADLRFTPVEAATFLNEVMGLNLSAETVTVLEAHTEGWIAGLQLAALSMQGQEDINGFIEAFTGSHRFILDYLTDEVLERRPKGTKNFLLQTSILDRLCASLCDAVTGQSDGQMTLERLEQANLFIVALDDERKWYRYHHLFAEVLRNRLRQAQPDSLPELHRRASAWYEAEGLIDEAIRHALTAPDAEQAAALVERHSMAMLHQSQVLLIRTWLEQLPAELVQTRPRLILAHSWSLLLTKHQSAVEQWLATPPASTALQSPDLPADVVGLLALLRATMARFQRNSTSALEFAQQVLDCVPEDNQGLRASATYTIGVAQLQQGDVAAASQTLARAASLGETTGGPYIALIALEELSTLRARQGQLSQTIQTCQQANRLVTRWGGRPMPAAGMAHIAMGEVLYERNNLVEAARTLTYGIGLLRGSIEQSVLAQGYVALARVHLACGEVEDAFATIQRGEDWFTQMQVAVVTAGDWLALGRARLCLGRGQLAAVAFWAQTCQLRPEDTGLGYLQQLTLVRLGLAQSRRDPQGPFLADASQTLNHLLTLAETSGWWGHVIEILALQALVCQAQSNFTSALTNLERALILAEPEGYIRLFVDEGEPMTEMLRKRKDEGRLKEYVHKLLAVFPAGEQGSRGAEEKSSHSPLLPRSPAPLLIDPLSERELELLRLVAAGRTNQEIAQELFLAIGTVKKHLNNIFGKLNASSRTQAIARARELSLF